MPLHDFFFQIKARQDSESDFNRWIWPPVFSGKVSAENKNVARALVDAEYGQKFPMRVLAKDIQSSQFLLSLREIEPDDQRTKELFFSRPCKMCGQGFRIIDHYNNHHQRYAGRDFCSDDCKGDWAKEHDARLFCINTAASHPPVIYRIKNINSGMAYVGQTTQPFTLRWWQHFFHGTNTKFHQAIAQSKMTEWEFSILEVVDLSLKGDAQAASDFICSREQHWIEHHNTIKNGYNTATAKVMPPCAPLLDVLKTGTETQ